jgi:hypothetical protein
MGLTSPPHEFCLSSFAIVDENKMDRNHDIVTCTLHDQENVMKSDALIDYGTTGYAFIDEDYACQYHLPLHLLKSTRNLTVINGRPVTSGAITNQTPTYLTI